MTVEVCFINHKGAYVNVDGDIEWTDVGEAVDVLFDLLDDGAVVTVSGDGLRQLSLELQSEIARRLFYRRKFRVGVVRPEVVR